MIMGTKADMQESLQVLETDAKELLTQLGQNMAVDQRALALARTNLEQAIMWANKSVEGVTL